VNYYNTIQ